MNEFEDSYPDANEIMGYAVPAVRPPQDLKAKLLARIRTSKFPGYAQALPGIHVLRASEKPWKSTPYPGVSYKTLHVDRDSSMLTSLLKLEPGAVYPIHRHTAAEHCLVVEGDVVTGDVSLAAGDYEIAEAGSVHAPITTTGGTVLLIISSIHDEMLT